MSSAISWLFTFASRGASELFLLSWQAMILVSCVWLGLKLVRVKSPALRHQIWLLTLLALALLPLATALARRFPMIQAGPTTLSYVIEAPGTVLSQGNPEIVREPSKALPLKGSANSSLPSTTSFPTGSFLFAAWLFGAVASVVRLACEQRILRQSCKRAKTIPGEGLEVFDSERLTQARIGLRLSAEIDSPILCGIFRPVVLLPENLAEWTTPAERQAIIEHEIAHVARRDPFVNLFQTVIRVIFFFHPLIRYACRQLNVERELACDARVMQRGTRADVYAESLLKVAEHGLMPRLRHQLGFLSAKQVLERRVEMIVSGDGARMAVRYWKGVVLSAGLIATVAWLLIPTSVNSGLAQTGTGKMAVATAIAGQTQDFQTVKALGDRKAFAELIEIALRNPDPGLRYLAAIRLTSLEGDGSTRAMIDLYNQTSEPNVKTMLIDTLARASEIEPLTKIALTDQNSEYRQRALVRIKFMKANSESADIRNWEAPGLADMLRQVKDEAPPPPPPQPVLWRRAPPPPPRL